MSDHDTSASHTVTHTEYERETDTRWGHRNPGMGWLLALLGIPLLLAALAAFTGHSALESDLGKASVSALADSGVQGLDGVDVNFSGRDATVNLPDGVSLSAGDRAKVEAALTGAGARVVNFAGPGAAAGGTGTDGDGTDGDGTDASASPEPTDATGEENGDDSCDAAILQSSIDSAIGEDKVLFDKFRANPDPQAKGEVDAAAVFIKNCADAKIELTGNVNPNAAKGLDMRRAEAVKKALIAAGVSADAISTVSAGTSEPQGSLITNRYVDIKVK